MSWWSKAIWERFIPLKVLNQKACFKANTPYTHALDGEVVLCFSIPNCLVLLETVYVFSSVNKSKFSELKHTQHRLIILHANCLTDRPVFLLLWCHFLLRDLWHCQVALHLSFTITNALCLYIVPQFCLIFAWNADKQWTAELIKFWDMFYWELKVPGTSGQMQL